MHFETQVERILMQLRRFFGALVVLLAVASAAGAHDFPTNTLATGLVRITPSRIDLLIRVPLDVLHAIPFPMKGETYDLSAAEAALRQALIGIGEAVTIADGDRRLIADSSRARLSLPSDRSFAAFDAAATHIAAPPEPDTKIVYDQGYLDARYSYPLRNPGASLSIRTMLASDLGDRFKLSLRVLRADGGSSAFVLTSAAGAVPLDPSWHQAAASFVWLGIKHILSGQDHLLFLLCLLIPLRRLRDLVAVITAFTLGHSITLVGAALNLAPTGPWFPPWVETAIAASIVYMALENIIGADVRHRWMLAAGFGLVHGFGFSYVLRDEIAFAGSQLVAALAAFNLGIELGQLLFVAAVLPALALLLRSVPSRRMGIIVLSAIIAHTAWHWMMDRWDALAKTPWPAPTSRDMMILARWAAVVLAIWGIARVLAAWKGARSRIDAGNAPASSPEHLVAQPSTLGTHVRSRHESPRAMTGTRGTDVSDRPAA